MTLFDIFALLILLASSLVGFVRGATREVVSIVALVVAVALAVLSLRYSGPIARHAIHPNVLANSVAILAVFILAYILIRALGAGLAHRIQKTEALNGLDRIMGAGFGLARSLVVLGLFYLVFNAATPAERVPHWIKGAKLYPLASLSGRVLMALAPEGSIVAGKVAPVLEKAVRDGASDKTKASATDLGSGQDERPRKDAEDLVEKTR